MKNYYRRKLLTEPFQSTWYSGVRSSCDPCVHNGVLTFRVHVELKRDKKISLRLSCFNTMKIIYDVFNRSRMKDQGGKGREGAERPRLKTKESSDFLITLLNIGEPRSNEKTIGSLWTQP